MGKPIGYISIHRKIFENPLWSHKPFSWGQAWIDLLLLANYQDSFSNINGDVTEVKAGQVFRSQKTLAQRWGWSQNKLKRYLKLLEKLEMCTFKRTIHATLLTISNYEAYQSMRQSHRPLNGENEHSLEHSNEHSNERHINNTNNTNKLIRGTSPSNRNTKKDKTKYLDHVWLSDDEAAKLKEKFGPDTGSDWIRTLDEGIAVHGYKYASHYRAILKWAAKEAGERETKTPKYTPNAPGRSRIERVLNG